MNMYQEIILEHYKHPQNRGQIDNPDTEREGYNPLCGDKITVQLKIEDNRIKDIKFTNRGCAISTAAMSLLTEHVKGKTLEEVKEFDKDFVLKTLGIAISPARVECVLLGLKTVKLAVYEYLVKQDGNISEKDFKVKDA